MTPTQRAFRQFVRSMFITAFFTGAYTAAAIIISGGFALNWGDVLFMFVIAFTFSVAHSFAAYVETQYPNDATIIAGIVDALEARIVGHTPLQGGFQGAFQGPLVVVHAMQPQNGATTTIEQGTTLIHPNIPATGQVLSETNPTAPQA